MILMVAHRRSVVAVAIALLVLPSAACGGSKEPESALPRGSETVDIDPASFTTKITNRYWPMAPGTRWTYREIDEAGKELEVIVTASSETKKTASGIDALVIRDTVRENGELIEDTFDWYAEDENGNVWYLGEDTAEFEGGAVSSRAGSWEAGVDGALPGIIVPGDPADGMAYRQEYYKGEAEDNGEVLGLNERVTVRAGSYRNLLMTKDTTTLDPQVVEYKFYAATVGPVLILGVSGGSGREELVRMERVGPGAARTAGTVPLGEIYP